MDNRIKKKESWIFLCIVAISHIHLNLTLKSVGQILKKGQMEPEDVP